MTETRNPLRAAIDYYLKNDALMALTAFMAAGLMGTALGVTFASIITGSLFWALTTGGVIGLLFAVWGAHSALPANRDRQYQVDTFFGPWLGGSILFSCAFTIVGVHGTANILLSLALSAFVAFWLVVAPKRQPYPEA